MSAQKCPRCEGVGAVGMSNCYGCEGKGWVESAGLSFFEECVLAFLNRGAAPESAVLLAKKMEELCKRS